ncbi:hypothetical protein EJ08DRAFT_529490 [Tothia fuscella]|uniref:J domain-containing protein n=1 Tax=Tothia fuscella TaxID=1048955 RepID=A0A9P4NGK1_9PEZI|nr:hypothetical protein EJ08DRAFT_529490 [Tothia fuscella]
MAMDVQKARSILGLRQGQAINRKRLRKAHRRLALRYHPDLYSNTSTQAKQRYEARFRAIQEAYEFLFEPLVKRNPGDLDQERNQDHEQGTGEDFESEEYREWSNGEITGENRLGGGPDLNMGLQETRYGINAEWNNLHYDEDGKMVSDLILAMTWDQLKRRGPGKTPRSNEITSDGTRLQGGNYIWTNNAFQCEDPWE